MNKPRIILLSLLILGILFRVTVMTTSYQFRDNTDVLRYKDWGMISYLHGPQESYKPTHLTFGTLPNNQPPGSTYVIAGMYYPHIQAAKVYQKAAGTGAEQNAFIIGPLLNTFLRLPQIIADLVITLLIYMIVKKHRNTRSALIAASLFLFNPVAIYNSALWGQMDAIPNMFFILSLFLLIKKNYRLSISAFLFVLYIKLSLVFILPYFFLLILKLAKKKQAVVALLVSMIILLIMTLPISANPLTWFMQFAQSSALGEMQNITAFAFNFWWTIFAPIIQINNTTNLFTFSEIRLIGSPDSSSLFAGLPLFAWGILLFLSTTIPIFYFFIREKKFTPQSIFLLFSLLTLLGFLFLPRMHERYLYPLFPLLATYVGLTGKKYIILISLSLLNFINLYLVWHPSPIFFFPSSLMNNQLFQWTMSAAIALLSSYFYFSSLRYDLAKNKK